MEEPFQLPAKLTYSLAETAEIIPCTERWLADKMRAGQFAARKINREWRFTMGDIEAIIEACAVQVQPKSADDQPVPPIRLTPRSLAHARRKGEL